MTYCKSLQMISGKEWIELEWDLDTALCMYSMHALKQITHLSYQTTSSECYVSSVVYKYIILVHVCIPVVYYGMYTWLYVHVLYMLWCVYCMWDCRVVGLCIEPCQDPFMWTTWYLCWWAYLACVVIIIPAFPHSLTLLPPSLLSSSSLPPSLQLT